MVNYLGIFIEAVHSDKQDYMRETCLNDIRSHSSSNRDCVEHHASKGFLSFGSGRKWKSWMSVYNFLELQCTEGDCLLWITILWVQ